VMRSRAPDAANLLHSLFSVRTLGLLGGLARRSLASYLSGLLIGAEMEDGARWLRERGVKGALVLIGSPEMMKTYGEAAVICALAFETVESGAVLPSALLFLARAAGLLADTVERR